MVTAGTVIMISLLALSDKLKIALSWPSSFEMALTAGSKACSLRIFQEEIELPTPNWQMPPRVCITLPIVYTEKLMQIIPVADQLQEEDG